MRAHAHVCVTAGFLLIAASALSGVDARNGRHIVQAPDQAAAPYFGGQPLNAGPAASPSTPTPVDGSYLPQLLATLKGDASEPGIAHTGMRTHGYVFRCQDARCSESQCRIRAVRGLAMHERGLYGGGGKAHHWMTASACRAHCIQDIGGGVLCARGRDGRPATARCASPPAERGTTCV